MTTFSQSNIRCIRNFKSWLYELNIKSNQKKIQIELDRDRAEMYYNGGYSPKMTICDCLNLPFEN